MTTYILFHARKTEPFAPCLDGLFAAYAAKLAIPEAILIAAEYNKPPKLDLTKGDTVYLLDLTYPAHIIEGWADVAKVIVLDHHKQAMSDLQYLTQRVSKTFDMNRSGAVISWEYFHPGKSVPKLFQLVQDRDLWTKKIPNCDLVNLGLVEATKDKNVQSALETVDWFVKYSNGVKSLTESGELIQEEIQSAISYAVKHHSTRCVMGWIVPFFKAKTPRQKQALSDIGNALCDANPKASFAIVQAGNGWGLRSKGRVDVSVIAKQMGGGGHPSASGCQAELPEWLVF